MRSAAACTIATLVESDAVRLEHVAGPDAAERAVFSATCIVRREDLDTLREGDLVVIGVLPVLEQLPPREFADLCARARVSAIAWPEWMSAGIPAAIVEGISAGGVACYVLPGQARLADVVEAIAHAHAAPDVTRFQRLLHMQQQLVESLLDEPPVESMVRKLADLTGGIAGVTDERGNVEAASGVLPFVLLRQEAAATSASDGVIEVAGWVAVGRRLRSLPGEAVRWLFVARRHQGFATSYVQAAANVTAALLDGTRRINEIIAHQDLATRAFVLKEALETEPYETSELLATRAGALGIDFAAEARVIEVRRARQLTVSAAGPRSLRDAVLAAFTTASLLVLEHDGGATVLVQSSTEDLDQGLDRLLRSAPGLLVGVGRPLRRIGEARVSWHDATLAAQTAQRTRGRSVVRYDDFDLGTRLLADVDRTDMSYWVDELLAPLRERPMLMESLVAYFDQSLDIMKAAKQLDIHHNTMRYRLTKVEEALGGSIQSPARIASLHLALSVEATQRAGTKPLKPAVRPIHHAADIGDTDVLRGGAVDPGFTGAGEQPIIG
ncbi:PucR family transcriptional regulator [Microbacterium sp.]|uniref:PucR family transcriptional regulator n=1 Tax=Microbacterium sp. TaxID=51671 RepID=UPI0028115E85|nr:helix-turn-helix domain-containing protein [Microbacterium sp.]